MCYQVVESVLRNGYKKRNHKGFSVGHHDRLNREMMELMIYLKLSVSVTFIAYFLIFDRNRTLWNKTSSANILK